MLVVTTDGIPGFEVRAVIGEVVGVTARSFNPFVEGVKSLNGKLNPQLVRLLQQIRQEAVDLSVTIASKLLQRNVSKDDNLRLIEDTFKHIESSERPS